MQRTKFQTVNQDTPPRPQKLRSHDISLFLRYCTCLFQFHIIYTTIYVRQFKGNNFDYAKQCEVIHKSREIIKLRFSNLVAVFNYTKVHGVRKYGVHSAHSYTVSKSSAISQPHLEKESYDTLSFTSVQKYQSLHLMRMLMFFIYLSFILILTQALTSNQGVAALPIHAECEVKCSPFGGLK